MCSEAGNVKGTEPALIPEITKSSATASCPLSCELLGFRLPNGNNPENSALVPPPQL